MQFKCIYLEGGGILLVCTVANVAARLPRYQKSCINTKGTTTKSGRKLGSGALNLDQINPTHEWIGEISNAY